MEKMAYIREMIFINIVDYITRQISIAFVIKTAYSICDLKLL